MRKNIIAFFLFLAAGLPVYAQQKVIITMEDGETIEKKVWEVRDITFEDDDDVVEAATPEAVDLGLSVKWASFNYGASSEEEVGALIGWGELTGKNTSTNLKWYPTLKPEGDIILTDNDIVYQKWGDQWRMPSVDDFNELMEKCTWDFTEVNGVKGFTVTGSNGNSIFLPVTGYRVGDTVSSEDSCYYWSGILDKSDVNKAFGLMASVGDTAVISFDRYTGLAIRAVYGEYANAIVLDGFDVTPDQYSASITSHYKGDIGHITSLTLYYSTSSSLSNAKQLVSTASSSGQTTFDLSSLSYGTTYYYYVEANYNNGSKTFRSEINSFTTLPKYLEAQAVDLGLSVKWASWNMGATSITDYGKVFGWGDPDGSITESGKWSTTDFAQDITSDESFVNISGTKYDIATNIWGGKWRLPTVAELEELFSQCTVTYKGQYQGSTVNGYLVTAKNGESIFIPANGFYNANGQSMKGKTYLWSSERTSTTYAKYERVLQDCTNSTLTALFTLRMSVRPVCDY